MLGCKFNQPACKEVVDPEDRNDPVMKHVIGKYIWMLSCILLTVWHSILISSSYMHDNSRCTLFKWLGMISSLDLLTFMQSTSATEIKQQRKGDRYVHLSGLAHNTCGGLIC